MQLYSTSQLLTMAPNIIKRSFAANLMRLQPNGNMPIFGMSAMAKAYTIGNVVHSFWAKQALFPRVTLSAAALVGDTTLTVVSSGDVIPGSLLMHYRVTAGSYLPCEIIRVTAVPTATSLTVVRGFAGTTAAAIANSSVLIEIGNAYEEGSAMPTSRAIVMSEHVNNTQIFRNSWDAANTAAAVSLEPGVQLTAENKMDAMFFHGQSIEWFSIFGRKSSSVVNGKPCRTMDGIEALVTAFAPGNIRAAASTTTFKQLEGMLHPVLDTVVAGQSSSDKIIWCGSQAMEVINDIGVASGRYELTADSTVFGTQFRKFRTSRGNFSLIEHPLLNSNNHTKGMAIIGDLGGIDWPTLRKTKHEDVAFNGTDAVSGVFTTELTMELTNPLGWGIIHGLTAAA